MEHRAAPPEPEQHANRRPGAWVRRSLERLDWTLPVALVCLTVGVVLRAQNVGFPARLTMDEPYFVEPARRYLIGLPDLNDHPPLGKLLLAAAMWLLGDNPIGWRIVPLLVGLLSIPLAIALARQTCSSARGPAIATILLSLDGFLIAYSRTALLDGLLVAAALGVALATVAGSPRGIVVAGLLVGLAGSIKWTGFALVAPLLFVALQRGASRRTTVFSLLLIPSVAFLTWSLGLWLGGGDPSPVGVLTAARELLARHLGYPLRPDRLASPWYSWLWMENPFTLRIDSVGDRQRYLSTLSNPLVWWAASATMAALAARSVLAWLRPWLARIGSRSGEGLPRGEMLLLLTWLAPLLPWVLVSLVSTRASYIYHYLPSHAVALVALSGALAAFADRRRLLGALVVTLLIATSLFFLPLNTQLPLSRDAYEQRMLLPEWR